jgi:hypothetical protein
VFVAVLGAGAAFAVAANAAGAARSFADRPFLAATLLIATLALQARSLDLGGKGAVGVSAIGLIVAAIAMGAGVAMTIAVLAAVTQWVRRRGLAHRALFDASNFALAAGAASVVYRLTAGDDPVLVVELVASTAAGLSYAVVNNGLLCLAMSIVEHRSFVAVWRERFAWAWLLFVAFGPAAGAFAIAAEHGETAGVGAFLLLSLVLVVALGKLGTTAAGSVARTASA